MPSDKPKRRFADIIDNIDAVLSYTEGISDASFAADRKTIDAVERCLLRISEAAIKLGDEAEQLAPGQPWSQIRGLGNRLRHEYDLIEVGVLWRIVIHDLAPLRAASSSSLSILNQRDT